MRAKVENSVPFEDGKRPVAMAPGSVDQATSNIANGTAKSEPQANARPKPVTQALERRWRPQVEAFADAMEAKLRKHDWQYHWSGLAVQYLFSALDDTSKELRAAVTVGNPTIALRKAADVANYAMMLADIVRRGVDEGIAPAAAALPGRNQAP
jgi:hypothetical protein